MAELDELPRVTRLFLRTYPWRRISPTPWSSLSKPLSACRLALVSSAGFTSPDQPRFDESIRGGDTSFREIPADSDPAQWVESHRSDAFDHAGLRRDPNLAFPIDRVRELVKRGRVGSAAGHHLSFMGSITAPARLCRDSAPRAARKLAADAVDIALLIPV